MLKDLAFPARRELLPQMLATIMEKISKHFVDDMWRNRLKVCPEEILINIIDYSGSAQVYVTREFINADKILRLEFVDEGTPYNPLAEKSDVDIDERSTGGLGIFLYTTMMDKLEYRYEIAYPVRGRKMIVHNNLIGDAKLMGYLRGRAAIMFNLHNG